MRSRMVIAGGLGLVVVLLAWNFLFFGPAGKDQDHAKQRLATAQQQAGQLAARLRELRKISVSAPEQKAKLEKLNAAVPVTPDLEGFIRSAVDLEQQAGVDWVDVEPSQPTPGVASASQIKLSIVISGGFFQVLDYLNRLEALSRLVVVDSISITTTSTQSAGSTSGTTPTTTATTTGPPQLSVTLNARMFTQAAPAVSTTGGVGTPGNSTPTTAATPTTGASK